MHAWRLIPRYSMPLIGLSYTLVVTKVLLGYAVQVVSDTADQLTERQSARISKITNCSLTRSGAGCFIAVTM